MNRGWKDEYAAEKVAGMKVIVAPTRDCDGKFAGLVGWLPDVWAGDVLDVGCRSGGLRHVVSERCSTYCGVDLAPPADVIANLDAGLPLADRSFDTVVALDVLEHTDDMHFAFREICRVARTHVLLSLPNAYESSARLRFLLGQPISGKYGLPTEPPADRHRWLFSHEDARRFTRSAGEQADFVVKVDAALVGPRRGVFPVSRLVARFPNLLSPTYVCLLARSERAEDRRAPSVEVLRR